ncbi:hypothetical protein Kpol_457p11 [Vanderwaltozyma polyspora DSM 70294]|uniref:Geranylgeranyl pyrophosphate synthase n=1 Tax=Vanderwaltozyma polyspora (strain ATCC 22028 / DSM 70294 / BCRC 21397 / CBS 2163 / NBRC 10782 / NRRL Y-8283 / UCD 57-17) TaxID=436907 RepID=A7TQV2_VANPO|nr:uncharacterized protein Kpol_457p11 [Vanderwaltozyma polyspora DSM 70294]EDO15360.1 hypothetical protein Kpol_457p11 [Vanderwaltozyma polyspora DSM 70294]
MVDIKTLVEGKPIWSSDYEDIVQSPYNYLAQQPGKNFRSLLVKTFNQFYGLDEEQILLIDKLVGILHTASLLIDDIEDNSVIRRGMETAHLKYGIPMTINSANYMYFKAMEVLQDISKLHIKDSPQIDHNVLLKELMIIFNEELINLHRGQALDIYWRDTFPEIIPDEDMYFNMVMNKTGGLFRLAVRIMETLNGNSKDSKSLVPLANLLGILYQVRDDLQNLTDQNMIEKKGYAEDISEGKLSFPIIHGVKFELKEGKDRKLVDIIKSKTMDFDIKKEAVDYLENKSYSIAYTSEAIKNISQMIMNDGYIPEVNENSKKNILNIVEYLSRT